MDDFKLLKLYLWRQTKINQEVQSGGKLFLGLPERWMDDARYRCINGHVSRGILLSEQYGDLCLKCYGSVLLTFPEDKEEE